MSSTGTASALDKVITDLNGKASIYKDVIAAVSQTSKLPSKKSLKALDAGARQAVAARQKAVAGRLHAIMGKLVDKIGGAQQQVPDGAILATPQGFEFVRACTERLLERVDMYLDKSAKQNKQSKVLAADDAVAAAGARPPSSRRRRPQDSFAIPPDNSNTPFVPPLTEKPNAIVPLHLHLEDAAPTSSSVQRSLDAHLSTIGADANRVPCGYCHPYETELQRLEYAPHQFQAREPQRYAPIGSTEYTWVDTPEKLEEMNQHICDSGNVREVAVDLEHHSYRSFHGFVCLMQVSTRARDFLVDTLLLREELRRCNDWTTDPAIVKVLHGADRDIVWLQGNFGVYVVNMFDTGQAARLLEYPSFGLAYLLNYHCGVTADKQYQLADWRTRPLSKQMAAYAQADTHYLLYVHDKMTNELKTKSTVPAHNPTNYIQAVLDRSRDLCLQRYEKPIFTATSYQLVLSRRNQVLSPAHERIFAALYEWRDCIAREQDESTGYVLPTDTMLQLATKAPTNMAGLVEALNVLRPLVRRHAKEILLLIAAAKKAPMPDAASAGGGGAAAGAPQQQLALVTPTSRAAGRAGRSQSAVAAAAHGGGATEDDVAKGLFTPIEGVAAAADATRRTMTHSVTPSAGELVGTPAADAQATPAAFRSSSGATGSARGVASQSPVLEQDALWRLAGWASPVPVVCDAHNEDFDASEPLTSSLTMQRSSAELASRLANVDMSSSSSSSSLAAAATAAAAAMTGASGGGGPGFLSQDAAKELWLQATQEMQSLAAEQTDLRSSRDGTRQGLGSSGPSPLPAGAGDAAGAAAGPGDEEANAFPYAAADSAPGSPRGDGAAGVSSQGGAGTGGGGTDAGRIPSTMDEIFILSNRNRQLLRQSDSTSGVGALLGDVSAGGGNGGGSSGNKANKQQQAQPKVKHKKHKKSTPAYTAAQEIEFMEGINWVPGGTTEEGLGVRANNPPVQKKPRIAALSLPVSSSSSSVVVATGAPAAAAAGGGGSGGGGAGRHKQRKQGKHGNSRQTQKQQQGGGSGSGSGGGGGGGGAGFTPFDYAAARDATGAAYNPYLGKNYAQQHRNTAQAGAGMHHASKTRRGHLSRGRGGRGGRGGSRSGGGGADAGSGGGRGGGSRSGQGARRSRNS